MIATPNWKKQVCLRLQERLVGERITSKERSNPQTIKQERILRILARIFAGRPPPLSVTVRTEAQGTCFRHLKTGGEHPKKEVVS